MNVQAFRDRIITHIAPAPVNRFRVTFLDGGPTVITTIKEDLTFFCEQAEIPGKNLNTVEQKIYGPVRKIAYGQSFIDTTMTFFCTQTGMREKRFFDDWQEMIIDPVSNDPEYYDMYTGKIQLEVLDDFDQINYDIIFHEAYPINVSPITLSMGDQNSYAKITVIFAYRYWKHNPDTLEELRKKTNTFLNGTGP